MQLDLRAAARRHMPTVPRMEHLAGAARETWRGRMVNEYMSSRVFDALAGQMKAAGYAGADVAECKRFAEEECRHGVLCGAVVEALDGRAVAHVEERRALPEHADVSPGEAVLRNLLSISCLSETVAVSLIAAEWAVMPEGPLRELLTRIWSDEIGHARFGWRILKDRLPGLGSDARARLGTYLSVALVHLERHELAHLHVGSSPPPEGAALGLCDGKEARKLYYETVEEVIVPRLRALGVIRPPPRAASAQGSIVGHLWE